MVEHEVSRANEAAAARAPKRLFFWGINRMGEEYLPNSHCLAAQGSVPSVVSVTSNFQAERPLHPGAKLALSSIFEQAWPDPAKLGIDSRSAAILINESKETIAGHLKVRTDELFFIGEPSLGFHLGISGLLSPDSRLFHSAVDRQEIFAIAQFHQKIGIEIEQLPVDRWGRTQIPAPSARDVVAWQLSNIETGAIQNSIAQIASPVFYDATASGVRIELPENWLTALWDSRSWAGPAGLGVFARRNSANWNNPLPHIDNRVVPDSASHALIVASALAIDSWVADEKTQSQKIADANQRIRGFISERIADCDFGSPEVGALPHQLSFSFLYVDAQRLVSELADMNIAIDSGSACNSANMEPSHVLAAQGVLTHGNVRITLHHELLPEQVDLLLLALAATVEKLRA